MKAWSSPRQKHLDSFLDRWEAQVGQGHGCGERGRRAGLKGALGLGRYGQVVP